MTNHVSFYETNGELRMVSFSILFLDVNYVRILYLDSNTVIVHLSKQKKLFLLN